MSALLAGARWPWTGLATSLGPPNPGLSMWVYASLGYIHTAPNAPDLARAVQCLNVLALLAFLSFAFAAVSRAARERWLWAGALWAVNPLAIIFERKIWPPSTLPLASVALIACWWNRKYVVAAFLCGLLCALMAQIHLGVVFLAAALFTWTWIYDGLSFRWAAWIAGGGLGALPALPWLAAVLQGGGEAALRWRFPIPHFFTRWVLQPFGFGVEYTLGYQHFLDYVSETWWAGAPVIALAHAALVVIFVIVIMRAARAFFAAPRPGPRALFIGVSPEAVLVNALLWGYGGLLTLITMIGAGSHRHYLIVAAPLMALWCVRLVWSGERNSGRAQSRIIMMALCLAQAVISTGLLDYIHRTQIIQGEYGPTWRSQQPLGVRFR